MIEPGSDRDRCPVCGGWLSSKHAAGCPRGRGRSYLADAQGTLERIRTMKATGGDSVENGQSSSSGMALDHVRIRDNDLDVGRATEPRWLGDLVGPLVARLRGRKCR